MSSEHPRHQLVDALTHPVRFSLVAMLNGTESAEFAAVRDQLQVSDSVLSRRPRSSRSSASSPSRRVTWGKDLAPG